MSRVVFNPFDSLKPFDFIEDRWISSFDGNTKIWAEQTIGGNIIRFDVGGTTPVTNLITIDQTNGFIWNVNNDPIPMAFHGTVENNVFYFDSDNDSVAMGTDDSTYLFQQSLAGAIFTVRPRNLIHVGNTADQVTFATRRWSDTATAGGQIEFLRARNNETLVQNGDRAGGFRFSGWDGTKYIGATGIYADFEGTPAVDNMPIGVRIIVGDFATTASTAFRATYNNIVGFRTLNPVAELTFEGNAVFNYAAVSKSFRVAANGLANAFNVTTAGTVQVGATSAGTIASFASNVITLNEGGTDINLRMESTSYQRILFMDAGLNTIGFGTSFGDEWLYAGASEVVINDRSGTVNFRCESDANAYQLFVNATTNRVGIGIGTPSDTLHVAGSVTIGVGAAGIDYTLTFSGETNTGVLTWMEDEDYFRFNDDTVFDLDVTMVGGTFKQQGISLATASLYQERYSNDSFAANQFFRKSRGSIIGTYTTVQNNDAIGITRYYGSDGITTKDRSSTNIRQQQQNVHAHGAQVAFSLLRHHPQSI